MSIHKQIAGSTGGASGKDGRGIVSSVIDENGYLIITYTDGVVENAGMVIGEDGEPGQNGTNGRGIASSSITDGNLIITYTDGTSENLGKVIGESGAPGTSTIIKGNVNSDIAITAINNPQPGDSYIASGTWVSILYPQLNIEHPNTTGLDVDFGDLIVWNGDAWQNTGNIQGPKGEPGDVGNTGVGISSVSVNSQNHLIITYTDGRTTDGGEIDPKIVYSLKLAIRAYRVNMQGRVTYNEVELFNFNNNNNNVQAIIPYLLPGSSAADFRSLGYANGFYMPVGTAIDFNNLDHSGMYYLRGDVTANAPEGFTNASSSILLVSKPTEVGGSTCFQFLITHRDGLFVREFSGTSNGTWTRTGGNLISSGGSGFETHHIMSAQTDALRLANNGDAQLVRVSPTGQATIKSLSIMYGQTSGGQYELAILDKNGVVLGKTGLQSFSTPLGLKTHPIDVDVNVSPSNIYYLGIRVTQPNTDLHLAGNTINIADNTIRNIVPASYYRSNGNGWQGVNINVISGQNFIPWIKANAG